MMELMTGMKVMSSDGESLGKIIRIDAGSFIVEKGFFFPKDYEVPMSLVRDVRGDECFLTISKEALKRERDSGMAHDTGREAGAEGNLGAMSAGRTGATERSDRDEQKLTLAEEELEARKRVRDAGEVTVRKEVVTEHRQIDVPVTKEEVRVERTPATSASAPEGDAFQDKTIRVPVREEEVEVTKRPRVREEVRVSRTARQQEQRVEGDVRHEEARVERSDEPGRKLEGEERPAGYRDDET
jgi:uncharacterized protein (TIGR02271 family)